MATHWDIDADFRGESEPNEPTYEERPYSCPHCGKTGVGYQVQEKSPPEFFLQPHQMYPMDEKEFDHWLAILRTHFPTHPILASLWRSWYPSKGDRRKRIWDF
jgi:hypothetical protein